MCQRKTKQMREFEPILKANGYREIRSNGSHFIYSNGNNQITVNKDLNKMVRRRLIKENNLVERLGDRLWQSMKLTQMIIYLQF